MADRVFRCIEVFIGTEHHQDSWARFRHHVRRTKTPARTHARVKPARKLPILPLALEHDSPLYESARRARDG